MLPLIPATVCSQLLLSLIPVHTVCSAARALARKLAEEKQAAVTAARLAAEQSMDEEEIEALKVWMRLHLCRPSLLTAVPKALASSCCGASPGSGTLNKRCSWLQHLQI